MTLKNRRRTRPGSRERAIFWRGEVEHFVARCVRVPFERAIGVPGDDGARASAGDHRLQRVHQQPQLHVRVLDRQLGREPVVHELTHLLRPGTGERPLVGEELPVGLAPAELGEISAKGVVVGQRMSWSNAETRRVPPRSDTFGDASQTDLSHRPFATCQRSDTP